MVQVQEERQSVSNDSTNTKRKASGGSNVDNAFERLFGYSWGTTFALDEDKMTKTAHQLVEIFGTTKAARILNVRGSIKRRRIDMEQQKQQILNYKDIELPESTKSVTMEETVFAGQVIRTAKQSKTDAATGSKSATAKSAKAGNNIDNVLAKLNGPNKMNTVQKTNNDRESFKESDKQLQEDLEKRAQGKDAYLVKQDFLSRVDHRKFELERDERGRERAKRGTK